MEMLAFSIKSVTAFLPGICCSGPENGKYVMLNWVALMGGAGTLQVRLPSNRKFRLNLDPWRLKRNWESRYSNESTLGLEEEEDEEVVVVDRIVVVAAVLLPVAPSKDSSALLGNILRQSLTFLASNMYVLKLVHHASTPLRIVFFSAAVWS